LIIRIAANEQEIEQAIATYWANEPPAKPSCLATTLAHWLNLFATNPEGFWIAADDDTRQIVGVASATRRPPQWMLTNFFVLPAYQRQGIGKALLSHAYATHDGCERFIVHASSHPSAQSLYMQFGMYPLPHSIVFRGHPRELPTILSSVSAEKHPVAEILSVLNTFDQAALGFIRAVDHQWWDKQGSYFLVRAEDRLVGYFGVSPTGIIGPVVVSDSRWIAAALGLAIREQHEISADEHEIFVPGANRAALAYVLAHGYRSVEINFLFSSHPIPGLAQVIFHDTDLL